MSFSLQRASERKYFDTLRAHAIYNFVQTQHFRRCFICTRAYRPRHERNEPAHCLSVLCYLTQTADKIGTVPEEILRAYDTVLVKDDRWWLLWSSTRDTALPQVRMKMSPLQIHENRAHSAWPSSSTFRTFVLAACRHDQGGFTYKASLARQHLHSPISVSLLLATRQRGYGRFRRRAFLEGNTTFYYPCRTDPQRSRRQLLPVS